MTVSGIAVVSGPRGSGKTVLARSLVEGSERLLIVDPMGEHEGAALYTVEDILAWIERAGKAPRWRIVARVPHDEADLVFRAAWSLPPCTIMVDEADLYRRESGTATPGLGYLIEYGRHRGYSLVCVTRRPFRLPRDVTASMTRAYVFKTWEARDVKYWRDVLPKGAAEKLPDLPRFAFIEADLISGEFACVPPVKL